MSNPRDKLLRVRYHPSIAICGGRNEGNPAPDLDSEMWSATSTLNRTRSYISASRSGLIPGPSQDPECYFEQRGGTFHTEPELCVCRSARVRLFELGPSDQDSKTRRSNGHRRLWSVLHTWSRLPVAGILLKRQDRGRLRTGRSKDEGSMAPWMMVLNALVLGMRTAG
jgi:beta-galactosidase/beta-glucuronidase